MNSQGTNSVHSTLDDTGLTLDPSEGTDAPTNGRSKNETDAPLPKISARERGLLCLAVFTYCLILGNFSLMKHAHLMTTVFDMGIFDQSVWLVSRGYPPYLTTRGMGAFADHFTPILYLLAPFYWIWSSPRTLLLIQTVALGIGAFPVYSLARKRLNSRQLAGAFAIGYLAFPAMHWINLFDFHPDIFSTPLLLYTFYYLRERRWYGFFASVGLLLMTKETLGLAVALVGVYLFFTTNRRVGAVTITLGLAACVVALETLKYFNHGQSSAYISLYGTYGLTSGAIAAYLFKHPVKVLQSLWTEDNRTYLIGLFAPISYLCMLAPDVLLLGVPTLMANLLSNRASMHTIYYQYNAALIPFVFVAGIEGTKGLLDLIKYFFPKQASMGRRGVGAILAIGILTGSCQGPFWQRENSPLSAEATVTSRDVQPLLDLVPATASVSAQSAIAAQLSERRRIYMFPNPFQPMCWGNSVQALDQQEGRDIHIYPRRQLEANIDRADIDYVVLGPVNTSHFPLNEEEYSLIVRALLSNRHYGVIKVQSSAILLQRGAGYAEGRRLLQAEGTTFLSALAPPLPNKQGTSTERMEQ